MPLAYHLPCPFVSESFRNDAPRAWRSARAATIKFAALAACVVLSLAPLRGSAAWELSTDDTHVALDVQDDALVVTRLNVPANDHNWIARPVAIPFVSVVEIDGHATTVAWKFQRASTDDAAGTLSLVFASQDPPLELRSQWRARRGRGPVEHAMAIENRGPRPLTLAHQDSLSLRSLQPGETAEAWSIKRGGGDANTQGGVDRRALDDNTDFTLTSDCQDGASPVPWMALQVGAKRGLYIGWEFSGLGRIHTRSAGNGAFDVDVGNLPDFRTDVAAGETFVVPTAFVGCYTGDIDSGAYALHRFVIEKLRPAVPQKYPDPILAYNLFLDAGGTTAREADVLRSAETCRALGFELFMPDAMWFRETGDWRFDTRRFPVGIERIEKFVHENGMWLALWCAWTNGGVSPQPGSLSVRGPAGNPDWFSEDFAADWQPGPFYGGQICLGCEAAKQWAIDKTQWLVRNHHLDYLKHDCGPITARCNKSTHRHRDGADASYWATLGYYEVQDKLLAEFPDLLLENCSGGGHIKDFGVIQRTHYTVTTDTLSNLPDRRSIYDSTYALPPLLLQAYTYDNGYGVAGDDPGPFLWRSAMMGAWQIDPTNSSAWSREALDSAARAAHIYKEWVRPILHDCHVHHVLPRPNGVDWDGLFYWSDPLKRGTLYIFRPNSPVGEQTVKLAGLDPDRRYWVWSEDGSLPAAEHQGKELLDQGLTIALASRYSSDLIYVQDAAHGKPEMIQPAGSFALADADVRFVEPATMQGTFKWSPSQSAHAYRVVVADTPDLAHPRIETTVYAPATSLVCEVPAGSKLYWNVAAVAYGGNAHGAEQAHVLETPSFRAAAGITFVSDMKWRQATAGADNQVRRDMNYYGRPIIVGGVPCKHSVWTHAFPDDTPADIVIDVADEPFARFAAEVGLDAAAEQGSVRFEVLVDNQSRAVSPVLRRKHRHTFNVDVSGAKQVVLRVTNGGNGYSHDHAAWGNARFIDAGH